MRRFALGQPKDRATVAVSTGNGGITTTMGDYHCLCTAATPAC